MATFPSLPLHYDLTSHIMFTGVVLAFFLSITLLYKSKFKSQLLLLLGLSISSMYFVTLDLYLCYTGLMQHTLLLNDGSEFISLLIPPLSYFIIWHILKKQDLSWRQMWPHFIGPFLYFLNMYFFWRQPIEAKYNSYIDAYYPRLQLLEYDFAGHHDPLGIKGRIDWWILGSFIIYFVLSLQLFIKIKGTKDFWNVDQRYGKFDLIARIILSSLIFLVVFVWIEITSDLDAGDYFIGIFTTIVLFLFTYFIISSSKMLNRVWIEDKYGTSSLKNKEAKALYIQLDAYLLSDTFRNAPAVGLTTIAEHLKTSKSYISQSVSQSDFKNFNELINSHRIRLAKEALTDSSNSSYTLEAIGKQVGFGSKSSFYSAFKKETGLTPSAFLKTVKPLK